MAKIIKMYPRLPAATRQVPRDPNEPALLKAILAKKLVPEISNLIKSLLIDNPRYWPSQGVVQRKFNLSPLSLKKLRDERAISYYCRKGRYHYDPKEIACLLNIRMPGSRIKKAK